MIVLVYQMGKVGSQTVTQSLHKDGFVRLILRKKRVSQVDRFAPGSNYVVHAHEGNLVEQLMAKVQAKGLEDSVLIVSMIRDILSRNISAFFQNCAVRRNHWYFGSEQEVLEADVEKLIEFFQEHNIIELNTVIAEWPNAMKKATGFDLLNLTFDTEQGISSYTQANGTRLILCQMEQLSLRWQVIADATCRPRLRMVRENSGEMKWYGRKYKVFRETYRPTKQELDLCYGSDVMRHLYSQSDRTRFRNQWYPAN